MYRHDDELKPCPFCGNEDIISDGEGNGNTTFYRIMCNRGYGHGNINCMANTEWYASYDEAVAAWNYRVGDESCSDLSSSCGRPGALLALMIWEEGVYFAIDGVIYIRRLEGEKWAVGNEDEPADSEELFDHPVPAIKKFLVMQREYVKGIENDLDTFIAERSKNNPDFQEMVLQKMFKKKRK